MVSGTSFNIRNQEGLTPVHAFILHNPDQERHFGFFLNMLKNADLACLLEKRKFCDALIECRADINATDADGWTCLHDAIRFRRYEVVEYLLSKDGIHIDAPSKAGLLPLHLTLQCEKPLCSNSAKVNGCCQQAWRKAAELVQEARSMQACLAFEGTATREFPGAFTGAQLGSQVGLQYG